MLFQSTPSQRGRLVVKRLRLRMILFQSTPSQRGRLLKTDRFKDSISISIHALAKRATVIFIILFLSKCISIHALAKRATNHYPVAYCPHVISIHALAKRATSNLQFNAMHIFNFNPRPRKEGDLRTCLMLSPKIIFQSTPSQWGRPLSSNKTHQQ